MTAAAPAAAPAVAAAAAPAKPKTVGGFALTAKITFGKDKESKSYGKDNNPKRAGSASHGKFAKYVDGMTVQQAVDAGMTGADLTWDTKHGFIKIA